VSRRFLVAAVLVLPVLVGGCRHLPSRSRALPDCPGQWVSTGAIAGDFLLRQQVRIEAGDRVWSLQLVTQKRGDELLLLGLDPFGAKLFTVRQRGLATSVDALPAPLLEVPPLNLLRDLHRERFLALANPGADGTFQATRAGTKIREQVAGGRSRWRSFERLAGDPPGRVELRFEEPLAAPGGAARVTIDNGWCGYRAEITTLSEESLP
jgi:hypothetical protein